MNENKDFFIYTKWAGFQNFDLCNDHTKELYAILKTLYDNNNGFIRDDIDSIKVSSQDRDYGILSAHYKPGKASDLVFSPPRYMLYFAGLLHLIKPYNIYLGTYLFDGKTKNLHLHSDHDYSKRKNTLYYEKFRGVSKIDLYDITDKTVGNLMTLYFGTFSISFNNLFELTRNYLLTNLPVSSKKSIRDFFSTSLIDRAIGAGKRALLIGGLIAGSVAAYKLIKLFKGK